MKAAICIRYGRPHPGREKLAFETFGEALGFFGTKATGGVCEAPVGYMGPSGGGMIFIGGERAALSDLTATEEYQRLFEKAGFCVPDLCYEILLAGDDAVAAMGLWATVGSELGFM
jgi:hypothetical protein